MLSCLPGIASSEKRAETSATRSAPLAMTMNWTTVMIRNTTRPTTRLPPATRWPKVSMMWPAWPSSRISLVVAMLTASRNSVVISSTLGNTENSSGVATYSATSSSSTPMTMLMATSVSMSSGVSVSTIVPTTMQTPATSSRSL